MKEVLKTMNEIGMMVSSLTVERFKTDKAVVCISEVYSDDVNTAVNAYSRLCEILSGSGMTLSEYMCRLTVRDDEALFGEYLKNCSAVAEYNLEHDIDVLSELSKLTSEKLIDHIRSKFGIPDKITFPRYENGNIQISLEKAASYRRKFGTSFFADNKAFIYDNDSLRPVHNFDSVKLSDLKSYETQREAVLNNTRRFLDGKAYSSVLLYGDRGTGKSCTVKAVVNEYPELRIVLVPKGSVMKLYELCNKLSTNPLKFILFLDDMTFESGDPEYSFLKQALEGSVYVIPKNCAIYATTNRRHIIKETASEREDEHYAADARDEKASLSDRFGLYLTFMLPDKKTYIDIVEKLASDRKINIARDELVMLAERFAVRKGNRSPRTARQFLDTLDNNTEKKDL